MKKPRCLLASLTSLGSSKSWSDKLSKLRKDIILSLENTNPFPVIIPYYCFNKIRLIIYLGSFFLHLAINHIFDYQSLICSEISFLVLSIPSHSSLPRDPLPSQPYHALPRPAMPLPTHLSWAVLWALLTVTPSLGACFYNMGYRTVK